MKKVVSIALAAVMSFALMSSAFASDSRNENELRTQAIATLSEEDIFLEEEIAKNIAILFKNDMVNSNIGDWDADTDIEATVTMYAPNGEQITAYTFELTQGYIVVSAYLGVENLILEWSDVAYPIYDMLNYSDSERVIYLGGFNYYKASENGKIVDLTGNDVSKFQLIDQMAGAREIENVPEAIISIVLSEHNQGDVATCGANDDKITDPIAHANQYYRGPFRCNDYVNNWDAYVEFHRMSEFKNAGGKEYTNHCGPTAILNLMVMYSNRYNRADITNDLEDLFLNIAGIGKNSLFFDPIGTGGTVNATANQYIKKCCDLYNVNVSVAGRKDFTYNNIKTSFSNNGLAYMMLMGHPYYGDHHIIGYAYTRLVSSASSNPLTYIKVVDGWDSAARYVELSAVADDKYWEVQF